MDQKRVRSGVQILIVFLSLLYGGFYEFAGFFAGISLCILLVAQIKHYKEVQIYINISVIAVAGICVGYGLTVFYGIDRGMSWLGFLKILSLAVFVLVLMQISSEEKVKVFDVIPYSGILILLMSLFAGLLDIGKEYFFLSGRLGGSFQYSNTMALYFLCGIVVLAYRCENCAVHRILVGILYLGILLTGSRTVFLMSIVWFLYECIRDRQHRVFYTLILLVSVVSGILYVTVTGDYQNIGRFLTTSLNSSTMLGRFLYWQDGLHILLDHPFGLGYRGYEYLQGLYQTGNYEVMFIHNELLQFMLDIGVIPALLFGIAIIKSILNKNKSKMERILLCVICVHSLVDFDLQFLVMFFILAACLDIRTGKKISLRWENIKAPMFISAGVCCLLWGYFCIAAILQYGGNDVLAVRMFPYYTDANVRMLEYSDDLSEASDISEIVLKGNQNCGIAYSVRALVLMEQGDHEEAVRSQEQAIRLHPYDVEEYKMYLQILSRGIKTYENGREEEYKSLLEKVCNIPDMIAEAEERVSILGKKIRDPVDLTLPEDMNEYILAVKELYADL